MRDAELLTVDGGAGCYTAPAPSRRASLMAPTIRPFLLWLLAFYAGWLTIVTTMSSWAEVAAHWPIAAAMALGSYFAGSTPMGGGTVGFPVLVLFFDQPASFGRDFSFAVQSIGMVSASILILCRRRLLDWSMLGPSVVGAAIGTPIGLLVVAPFVPGLAVKLIFGVLWASFGILHLARVDEIVGYFAASASRPRIGARLSFLVGLGGGATVAATTGVGVDMLLYVVMVLLFRIDLRVAIPSSVVLMATTSLVGIASRNLLAGWGLADPVPHEVFANWLAAAPVVAVGAPFGTVMVALLPRALTLRVVSVLCVGQLIWTLWDERAHIGAGVLGLTGLGLLAFGVGFWTMSHIGRRWAPSGEAEEGGT